MVNSQVRKWCFTINNPRIGDNPALALDGCRDKIRYAVWQKERGESGTVHYQGFVLWKGRGRRMEGMKALFPRAHLEVAKGRCVENRKYCTKAEGRIEGPQWIIDESFNLDWD